MISSSWTNVYKLTSKRLITRPELNELRRNLVSASKQLAAVAEPRKERDNRLTWDQAKSFTEIPGPTTFTLLSNFLPGGKYYKRNLIEMNVLLKEEYGDLIMMKGLFGNPDTLLSYNPKDFEHVYRMEGSWPYRRDFQTFQYFRKNIRPDIYGETAGLLAEQGEKWKELRGKVNPVMMQPRIAKRYVRSVEEVADEFIAKLLKLRDSNNELPSNAGDEFNKWALESIALIALDSRLGCLGDNITADSDTEKMIQSVHDFFECTYKLEVLPSVWKYVKTPTYHKLIRALDTMTTISLKRVDEAIKRLKSSDAESAKEASVVEKLLKIDRNIALVMAMDMLLAGVDTTSYTTAILLYFIATNQEAQDKLRREILTILPEQDSKLTKESFNHIPYLRGCMKEANRIIPIAGGVIRKIPLDIVLSGYQIPKGTEVAMNHVIPSIEGKHFPNPKQFIPERWLNDQDVSKCPSAKMAHPFAHMPFGFGPRSCVGKRFADLEVETLVTKLIRNNKIEWNYGELKITSKLLTAPATPLRFKITEL